MRNLNKQVSTPRAFANHRWHKIRERVSKHKCYKDIDIKMEREEFCVWIAEQWPIILKLFKAGKTPSIDRINANLDYELSNLRIIDVQENRLRGLATKSAAAKARRKNEPSRFCVVCEAEMRPGISQNLNEFRRKKTCSDTCRVRLRERDKHGRFTSCEVGKTLGSMEEV